MTTSKPQAQKSAKPCEPDPNIVELIYSFDRRQLEDTASEKQIPEARKKPRDASEAEKKLFAGNAKFADFIAQCKGDDPPREVRVQLVPREIGNIPNDHGFPAQLPFAAVAGCVDARAPVELLFSQGFDDLYIMRIAGNSIGPDCSASLQYAIHSFAALKPPEDTEKPKRRDEPDRTPLRLVMALGHSDCGAVTAAVNTFIGNTDLSQNASEFLVDDSVRGLLGRIHLPAINLSAKALEECSFRPSGKADNVYTRALIELSVYVNAAWSAHEMQTIVGEYEFVEGKEIKVRYGVFDPRDCFVRSVEGYHIDKDGKGLLPPQYAEDSLSPPPADLHELYALARKLAAELTRKHDGANGRKVLGKLFRIDA